MKKIEQKLIDFALSSEEFREELLRISEEIASFAAAAPNEATVEGTFERILYALLKDIGIKFHPQKEVVVDTRRHTRQGRMDSRIGALVIEYKHHSRLRSQGDVNSHTTNRGIYFSTVEKLWH